MASKIDWSQVQELGQVRDEILAACLGCNASSVTRARRRLGIPAQWSPLPIRRIDWTKVEGLGKLPDSVIAFREGCLLHTVALARKRLNIPAQWPVILRESKTAFWDMMVPFFHEFSNTTIAHLLGVSHTVVAKERKRRGIRPYIAKPRVDWEKWVDLLGTNTDEAVAKVIGCDRSTVRLKRAELKIPAYRRAPRVNRHIDWATILDLGKVPDRVIAERLGCDVFVVARARKRLGIASAVRGRPKRTKST